MGVIPASSSSGVEAEAAIKGGARVRHQRRPGGALLVALRPVFVADAL